MVRIVVGVLLVLWFLVGVIFPQGDFLISLLVCGLVLLRLAACSSGGVCVRVVGMRMSPRLSRRT